MTAQPLSRRDRAAPVGDPPRLSGVERCALALALASIREDISRRPRVLGTGVPHEVIAYGPLALDGAVRDARTDLFRDNFQTANRFLRARLALLLRAVLRADAGDFGPKEETPRFVRDPRGPELEAAGWTPTLGGWSRRVPYTSLWELAAARKAAP